MINAEIIKAIEESEWLEEHDAKIKAEVIDEVNKAEDTLIKCFKKENEIWTIRMAFAELREQLKEQKE